MAFDLNNPDFIQRLVKEPITSCEISQSSQPGEGVAGDLKSLRVETGSGKTLHLIHKTFPTEKDQLISPNQSLIFKVENQFYSSLAPAINEALNSKEGRGTTISFQLPVPKYFSGFNDEEEGENDYITLEDVRSRGFKMQDKTQGLSYSQVHVVMENIGKFHAAGYNFIKGNEEEVLKEKFAIFFHGNYMFQKSMREMRGQFLGANFATAAGLISEADPELGGKLLGLMGEDFIDVANGILELPDRIPTLFPVIVQGDLWVNNILFKEGDSGEGEELVLIDFQQTHRGNIFEDLLYFMFTSTTAEFREENLTSVLKVYYQSFVTLLKELDQQVPPGFTEEFLLQTFNECVLSSFAYMCFAVPMQLGKALEPQELAQLLQSIQGDQPELTQEQRFGFMAEKLKRELKGSPLGLKRLTDMAREALKCRG